MKKIINQPGRPRRGIRATVAAWRSRLKTPPPAGEPVDRADPLAQRAWDWLRLLATRQVSDEDIRAFRHWVTSSPAHQAAYNAAKARWDQLKPLAGALLHTAPDLVEAYQRRVLRNRTLNRRAFLGLSAATAAAGAMVVFPPLGLWPSAAEWGADYHTATGEQHTLALTEYINVTLNTRTSARRRGADGQTVGLDLIAGEAAVDFAGEGHPFMIAAGSGRSLAQSGQFEVRYVENKVCVTCIAGAVWVAHPAGNRMLQARQQVIYDIDSVSGVAGIDPAEVSAWRRGTLVFRQTRLVKVIEEINRYRAGRVVLLNDSVRNQMVTGHFEIMALDRALAQLQYMFDLRARSLAGGILLLS